jgi:hypothetical protein
MLGGRALRPSICRRDGGCNPQPKLDRLAVRNDGVDDARGFITQHRLTYPILRDDSGDVGNAYGLSGLPTTFVLDAHGEIVQRLLGPQTPGTLQGALAEQPSGTGGRLWSHRSTRPTVNLRNRRSQARIRSVVLWDEGRDWRQTQVTGAETLSRTLSPTPRTEPDRTGPDSTVSERISRQAVRARAVPTQTSEGTRRTGPQRLPHQDVGPEAKAGVQVRSLVRVG